MDGARPATATQPAERLDQIRTDAEAAVRWKDRQPLENCVKDLSAGIVEREVVRPAHCRTGNIVPQPRDKAELTVCETI